MQSGALLRLAGLVTARYSFPTSRKPFGSGPGNPELMQSKPQATVLAEIRENKGECKTMTTAKDVMKLIKENDVKYADFRFTDPRGKWQHVTFDISMIEEDTFAE